MHNLLQQPGAGLSKNRGLAPRLKVLLQLYYSFVTPYLIYCLEILGNASDIHLQPLITTSKKC